MTNSCGLCLRHENYAINNVLINVRPGAYIWIGERPFDKSKIVKNICFHSGPEQDFFTGSGHIKDGVFPHLSKMKSVMIEDNLFYNAAAPETNNILGQLGQSGYDNAGLYGDPLFEDWENGNLELKSDSPAFDLGIKPVDLSKVGVRGAE